MLKVVAHTSQRDELARVVCSRAGFAGVCGTVTELLAEVEARGAGGEGGCARDARAGREDGGADEF
jgi:hypothetical protein